MKRDYVDFQDRGEPSGYLITFRCYGTWNHGDSRGSTDRRTFNSFGAPFMPPRPGLKRAENEQTKYPVVRLGRQAREVVKAAIEEVCEFKGFGLHTINVRSNHVHVVVSSSTSPERVMTAFKAYATRNLREKELFDPDQRIWSRHGSTKYLWDESELEEAIYYVSARQGRKLS